VSTEGSYVVERRVDTGYSGEDWAQIESTLVPNFNYAKVAGAAPFNLLINVRDMEPASINLVWITKTQEQDVRSDVGDQYVLEPTTIARIARSLRHEENHNQGHTSRPLDFVVKNEAIQVQFSR